MNTLVILGNGFDVAHRLPTKYSDFMEYVWKIDRDFYEQIAKYIFEDDLWNDFENALGSLEDGEIREIIDTTYFNYGDKIKNLQEELDFSTKISEILKKWINSIDTKVEPIVTNEIIDNNNFFINFNYTDTLEQTYNILDKNICYIHGKGMSRDKLIIGHHNTYAYAGKEPLMVTYQEFEEWLKYKLNRNQYEVEIDNEINKYYVNTYKDTDEIIGHHKDIFSRLTGVSKIFILGHSLSQIDLNYFKIIYNNVSQNCIWYISYYSEKDKGHVKRFIDQLGINKYIIDTFGKIVYR